MEKLNRKGFFSTLFGGIAGVVAGSTVKAMLKNELVIILEGVVLNILRHDYQLD